MLVILIYESEEAMAPNPALRISLLDGDEHTSRLLHAHAEAPDSPRDDPLLRELLDEEAYYRLFRELFLATSASYLRGRNK